MSEVGSEMAGSYPVFPRRTGTTLSTSTDIASFRRKLLICGQLESPGIVHCFRAECKAGESLRIQSLVPLLLGGTASVSVAVIAQGLPYSESAQSLPIKLPAGYGAVTVAPPERLQASARDRLTGVRYYPGPVIDTRTLVGGHCYVVVWSPRNRMGKYALTVGRSWRWQPFYWLQLFRYWWQIRGWFGLSRMPAVAVLLAGVFLLYGATRLLRSGAKSSE